MKKGIRDFLVLVISILGISFVYRTYMRTKGPLVRIIAFHDVADPVWFESVIVMLVQKYHVITPAQFHKKEFDTKKINILFTFDDGYQSWIDHCLPVLQKYNCKGLFFINSGLLDIAEQSQKVDSYMKERLLISHKKPLTWEGAKHLLSCGHSIGGHTVTHQSLRELPLEQMQQEIIEDKKRIEHVLSIILGDFAYPFGTKKDYSSVSLATVSDAGYQRQYSAHSGFVYEQVPVARTLIEKDQSIQRLCRWIEGGYDIVSFFKQ